MTVHAMNCPTRSRSAPPLSIHDVGMLFSQRSSQPPLAISQDLATRYPDLFPLCETHARAVYFTRNRILKLYSYLVDVSIIVANMKQASTKVPVPKVYEHGFSGNCAFIVMEAIYGWRLDVWMKNEGIDTVPARITEHIQQILYDLANLGLSHNDLNSRNILVSDSGDLLSIIDWDECSPLKIGEYRRGLLEDNVEPWTSQYLNTVDRMGQMLLVDPNRTSVRADFRCPPLVTQRSIAWGL